MPNSISPSASAGRGCVGADPEHCGRPPQQGHVPYGLRRSRQKESPRLDGERPDTPEKALLNEVRHRSRVRTTEPARQLRDSQPLGQLQQRERVPVRLSDDPIAYSLVETSGCRRIQQSTGIGVAQTLDHHHWKVPQLLVLAQVPHGEDDRHRFRQEPAGHEPEDLGRCPIEPLCIIHDADQRPLLGNLRQQAQHRQTDQKTIRRHTRAEAEGRAERIALRARQALQMAQQRRAELMNAGERELHLGLDSRSPRDAKP